jgi:hypothetical protein
MATAQLTRHSRHKESPGRKASKNTEVPFHRELCAVQKQYEGMLAALDAKDPARVRVTACRLVVAWLQVETAFIRFIERTPANLALGSQAWQERFVLNGSNYVIRALFCRALDEMPSWGTSPEGLRILRTILCWLQERLAVCSIVGPPDLASPHPLPFNLSRLRSRGRTARTRVRRPMEKR